MQLLGCLVVLAGVVSVHSFFYDSSEERWRSASCNCGWTNKGRIVGGKEVSSNKYPFVVALENRYRMQTCGATIITEWHVITAAHCTNGKQLADLIVRVGVHDLTIAGSGVRHRVAKVVQHEKYDNKKLLNDISLLVTQSRISINQNVGPACLPATRLSLTGQKLKALGWGRVSNYGMPSDTLQEVDLPVISFEECFKTWREDKELKPQEATNVCTFEKNKDTCKGDSGGPLVWLNPSTNRLTLAALVSYGGYCAGNQAAPNTDVSAFVDWINRNIRATKPETSACIKG